MTDFVLVHGAVHGAWCWDRVVPLLRKGSSVGQVLAVDLSGHGARREVKALDEITLVDYVEDLVGEIETHDLQDVILVGHSLAGMTLPIVANRIPGRIGRVVYLATSNPVSGQSMNELMEHPLSPISRGLGPQEMFCNDLDDESTAWLLANIGPEPMTPLTEAVPVHTLPASVASTYIVLLRDQALPEAFQREQAANAGVDEVIVLDAGHSAFASRPGDLADLLLAMV